MKRRTFLSTSASAGLTAMASGLMAAMPTENAAFELNEATIDQLQQKMKNGQLTAQQLTKAYLDRIATVGKKVNAVIELNPDPMRIAAAMDVERKAGKLRGPLHGIPVLIKDNIDTGDKMMTTAGAAALMGNIASKDAFIVSKLREAGAVLLGKTNLSEWANFRSTRSTSAWSSRGGQTRNPFALNRNPSGSSSGSGSAVSANLCAVAIGTETNGSIISPSSHCGVVGIKPTVGLLSRSGIIPISSTQDTAGPMTRTVKDAALLLGALAGVDPADEVTKNSSIQKDYTIYCTADALKGKRIGVEKVNQNGNQDVLAVYKKNIDLLKSLGAEIVDVELQRQTAALSAASYLILQYEFKAGVNAYLATANAKVKNLADVIAYNKANADKAMPFFKQELLEMCVDKKGLDDPDYKEALKKSTSARQIIDDLMKNNKLDAICSISSGPAGCIDQINGDYGTGYSFSSPAAMAGYPHITVPMGYVHGMPIGLSFVSGAWKEAEIIGMAYAYEQASKQRKAPGLADWV